MRTVLRFDGDRFAIQLTEIKAGKDQLIPEVNLSLAPEQIVEGVVTAADTGKPLPDARLSTCASIRAYLTTSYVDDVDDVDDVCCSIL